MTDARAIGSTENPITLQDSLKELVASGRVQEYVAKVLGSKRNFQSCLSSASIHENSFIKVPVALELPNKQRLRIHFWISSSDEQNIHDHRFDFASAVVSGRIENVIWRTDPKGSTVSGFRYHNDKHGRRLERHSSCKLQVSSRNFYRAGEFYSVHRDTLHTINHTRDTVSIILEDRMNLKPYANVYSHLNRAVGHTPATKITEDLLRDKLSEFCLQNATAN